MKTRSAKWGTGAIHALSERLQVEMPGLRGFSPASIKYMRLWHEAWSPFFEIRHSASSGSRHLPSDELTPNGLAVFVSIGFTHYREILNKCNSLEERGTTFRLAQKSIGRS